MVAIGMQRTTRASRIPAARIVRAGALAAVFTALANTVVRTLAVTLQPVDPGFMALGWVPPALFSLLGASGAALVFWLVSRRSQRPTAIFTAIAVGVLPVSLLPDLLLLQQGGPLWNPGANAWAVGALMVMHAVGFAIIVPCLTRTAHGGGTDD